MCGFAGARRRAAVMDVDRISAMGGVGQEQNPAWTREKMRRRKFSEEVELSEGEQQEAAAAVVDEYHDGLLDVMA
jgi:HSP20 family molecular chaperone IbpA